jgi:hypothetical protein
VKSLFRSKLALTLVALVMSAAAIAIPLSGSIVHSHATSPTSTAAPQVISKGVLASGDAVERTPQDVQRDAGKHFPKPAGGIIPFRPTMGILNYQQAKAQAAAQRAAHRPGAGSTTPATSTTPLMTALVNFDGASDVDGLVPPDTHGAVSKTQFVEVTNSHINVFTRTGSLVISQSLASFFGYFTQTLFDPRVLYDSLWKRWIVTADAFPESSTVQRQFIGISQNSHADGSYFIFNANVTFAAGDFWDFPQVGIDQDAVIMTANVFNSSNAFKGADCFAIAKARLYNGKSFSVPLFQGLVGTLAPPVVQDANFKTFLISAQPSGSTLQLYTMTNTSRPNGTALTGPVNVPVPAYSVPPLAPQPGVSCPTFCLDTSDSRFISYSTQFGDVLWQVHTVNFAGFATPQLYEINTATATLIQSAFFFASGTSSDFNASIVANTSHVFVDWSSTDVNASINAQVRFSGCAPISPCSPGAGSALFTSSNPLTADFDPNFGHQRWGDYSAVTLDPLSSLQAWLVNEKVNAGGDWGSRIGEISF